MQVSPAPLDQDDARSMSQTKSVAASIATTAHDYGDENDENILDTDDQGNQKSELALDTTLYKHSLLRKCSKMLFVLICTFVTPFIALTVLTLVLSSSLSKHAAMKLADSNVKEISNSVVQTIQTTISAPPRLLRQMNGEISRRMDDENTPFLYSATSVELGVPLFWDAVIAAADKDLPIAGFLIVIGEKRNPAYTPETYGILTSGFGDARKASVWWYRDPGMLSFMEPKTLSYEDVMDTVLNTTGTIVADSVAAPFGEEYFPWYYNAVNNLFPKYNSEIAFTDPYEDALFPGILFITCFRQLRNATHLIGVMGVDFSMSVFQDFMAHEHSRWNLGSGVAMIMNAEDGSLIATSDVNAPSTVTHLNDDGTSRIERILASDSSNEIVRATHKYWMEQTAQGKTLSSDEVVTVGVDGFGSVLLAVNQVNNKIGTNWMIFVAYPESEFTGDLVTMDIVNSVVSVTCMVLATITVICLSICFMIPLYRLKTEMRKVELMQLEDVKAHKSIFYEVFSIQSSFFAMKEKLRLWKAYLPEHVLLAEGLSAEAFEDENKEKHGRADDETASEMSHESEQRSKLSKVQSRTSGSNSDRSRDLEQNLGLKAVYRTASSVVIRISNYHQLAQNQAAFIDQHGLILDRIRKICARVNAALDYFDERQFHVSLNAMLPVKNFQQAAVRVALMIEITTKKANAIFMHDKREKMDLVFGISSGSTYCGTIGTSTLRKSCIYGPARECAHALSAIAENYRHLGVHILIDLNVEKHLDKSGYKYRPFGVYAIRHHNKLVPVYHVASTKDAKAAEWMYAMNEETRFSEWTPLHKAFSHMKKSKFLEALEELRQMSPDDAVVQRWTSFCKRMAAEERSYYEIQRTLEELKEDKLVTLYSGCTFVDALTSLLDVRKEQDEQGKEE